jgi:hypothetical protein
MEKFIELLGKDPWSMSVFVIGLILLAFYCGATWDSIQNLKKNMLTKADLELALANFKDELTKTFIPRGECVKQHAHGTIPLEEHAGLMARIAALERESEMRR